jgi:DNA-binding NarL/FixJ family response regulator
MDKTQKAFIEAIAEATARAMADQILARLTPPPPTTTREFKAQQRAAARAMRARGATFGEISAELHVSRATAFQWQKI